MTLIRFSPDFESWRAEARRCLAKRMLPEDVLWQESSVSVLGAGDPGEDVAFSADALRDDVPLCRVPSVERGESTPRARGETGRVEACGRSPQSRSSDWDDAPGLDETFGLLVDGHETSRHEIDSKPGAGPNFGDFDDDSTRAGSRLAGDAADASTGDDRSSRIFLPATYFRAARSASFHRDRTKWDLLYRVAWRLVFENPELLEMAPEDPDVVRFFKLERDVRQDAHRMESSVRFKRIRNGDEDHYVAKYRPEHPILELVAPFFQRRFQYIKWTICTPDRLATWNGVELSYRPGLLFYNVALEDEFQSFWTSYYSSVFQRPGGGFRSRMAR